MFSKKTGARSAKDAPKPSGSRPRLARSLGPFLVVLVLALIYGAYMQISLKSQDKRANEEWNAVKTALAARSEQTLQLVAVARELVENEPNLENAADSAKDDAASKKKKNVDAALDSLEKIAPRLAKAETPTVGANADVALSAALGKFFIAVKDMETLRADERYRQILDELSESAVALTNARSRYNDVVMKANSLVVKFPGQLVAPLFKIEPREYFNAIGEGEAKTHPILKIDATKIKTNGADSNPQAEPSAPQTPGAAR